MECIKMTKWSWYHVKTSELEKLSSIIPRDVTSYLSICKENKFSL